MNIKSNKGVTLVEVMVTVAILAIIIIPVSTIFNTAYSSFIAEADRITAQQGAREVLYGKTLSSYGSKYGLMGDLERSNATSAGINIDDEPGDISISGQSISIRDSGGSTKKYSFETDLDGRKKLFYENSEGKTDYFRDDMSSNNRPVVVKEFTVEKVKRHTETDSDILNISVTVLCGKSGEITLNSTYRFPDIE